MQLLNLIIYLCGSFHSNGQPIQVFKFKITSDNYLNSLEVLHNYLGRNEMVIQNHIKLFSIYLKNFTSGHKYVKALWLFYNKVVVHVRSYATLGFNYTTRNYQILMV